VLSRAKYDTTTEKIELYNGKIFFSDEERLQMLRLLVENVGLRKTIEGTAGAEPGKKLPTKRQGLAATSSISGGLYYRCMIERELLLSSLRASTTNRAWALWGGRRSTR
jgi:hypothetical protein